MLINKRIPKDFYKLFRTRNMDAYMMFLVSIYDACNAVYAALGLTIEEGQAIIGETASRLSIEWMEDTEDAQVQAEGDTPRNAQMQTKRDTLVNAQVGAEEASPVNTQVGAEGASPVNAQVQRQAGAPRIAQVQAQAGNLVSGNAQGQSERGAFDNAFETRGTPSAILNTLIAWGWIRSDYDERQNTYILSFPEYSQLYVELFKKLLSEDDGRERESILSVYSALYTYQSDQEKNNEILKSALHTSINLELLLSNMHNGMRTYFDELSRSKNFIEIQQVLVNEINNSDSERYAILTTTDSFYRYKESVKELISQILNQNDSQKPALAKALQECEENTAAYQRARQAVRYNEEAEALVYQIEREFDLIERKYNKLVEQKAVFAKRALARIQYIFQEGAVREDGVVGLIRLIDKSGDADAILDRVRGRICLTAPFKMFDDNSMYRRRDSPGDCFEPVAVEKSREPQQTQIADFVPKPLYTKKQLKTFCDRNMKDGVFEATSDTVQSVEDLEKMLFLWQEMVGKQDKQDIVKLGGELKNESGFTFTQLCIELPELEE